MQNTRNNWLALALGCLVALPVCAQSKFTTEALHARAATARTTAQHAAVAKEFRLQAESLGQKAAAHEKEAEQLMRSAGPMVHKWPAMAPRKLQEEKALAVQARRQEREARKLADHHLRMAVEAQADAKVEAGN